MENPSGVASTPCAGEGLILRCHFRLKQFPKKNNSIDNIRPYVNIRSYVIYDNRKDENGNTLGKDWR